MDFLTGRPQVVTIGSTTSSTLVLNTGAPQGCCLSPRLYSIFTHDCSAIHGSNRIIKFADDTTDIGLMSNNDETEYRDEVARMVQGQQPCTECQQDQGAHHGLQEQPRAPLPMFLRRNTGGNRQLLRFPGNTSPTTYRGPTTRGPCLRRHNSASTPTVPQEMWHKHTMAYELLPWHHRARSDRWCHCVVRQYHCSGQESHPESRQDSGKDHRVCTSIQAPVPQHSNQDK